MKTKLLSSSIYMMLSIAMLSSCISTMATDPKEVQIYLSEVELQEIFKNQMSSFVYLGKETSNIVDVVREICSIDADKDSLVHGLRSHIEKGFNIATYDSVAQALEHAELLLRDEKCPVSAERRAELTRSLNAVMDQVEAEQLNLDAEILSFMKDSVEVAEDGVRRPLRVLVIPNKLDVLGSAKFRKDVLFKKHVKIQGFTSVHANAHFHKNLEVSGDLTVSGALSVSDTIISGTGTSIGCDVTVGCNLNLAASSSSTVGNITQNGMPFISSFGTNNAFVGTNSGNSTMTGVGNSGFGANVLAMNTAGSQNTALGSNSLAANTTGGANVAVGNFALESNTTGQLNTAIGHNALHDNITGSENTAIGHNALEAHLVDDTVAVGVNALVLNTTGLDNTAVGHFAMPLNITGSNNVALGNQALPTNVNGNDNIGIGKLAGNGLTTGSGNVYVAAAAGAGAENNTIRIGIAQVATFIAGIRGATTGVADAIPVLIDSAGQLGTISSSIKFKHSVADMGDASAKVLALRPVTFAYNDDATETMQYGLIAEEVDALFPAIVVKDANGQPYTVQYHVLPVLLLNEMKKLAARVAALEARN